MAECLAVSDLGASINLIPLSVWNKLSLPELILTLMTLELADRSFSRPIGVAEDVYVKVGKFYFPTDFVVVDFDADPRVPLILGISFLKIGRALIDVFEGELTLHVGKEAIRFNLDQTSRYSANDNYMTANRIDDLPPHLEYAFLEGDDKLPIIIAKDLKDEEKTSLIKVLKLHKQALAWQFSDIKGIPLKFCTHKILMEDDFKPVVQHQRRVNLKVHEVIKKEVLKLLDAGLIYPISDSPWMIYNVLVPTDHYEEAACAHHGDHMMRDSIQLDHVVDSHADYMSDSNIILYDPYVKDNKDFKQKENKYFEDFLDMKSLKEKVENKLIKQDQSLQTVHMLCRPRPNSNELNRVAIGYKNSLCLTRAKQVQPAVYNGHEIIKDNHKPTIVHDTEDTLEIAEITRKKMNDKMNDPECVTRKGIQKALTKEVKEMKDVFEELEAEVAQYAVDRKRDAIELKNLLIANDNLIVACLSQEVFCVATNSELNVAQLTEMYVAHTTAEARCLALEAELANLRDTNSHDNQKELINH
nr:uncharacterized protein [Tanacetum cinerariifolium]